MKNDNRAIGRDPQIAPGVYYIQKELCARIDGDRIIVEKKESEDEDERIRKFLIDRLSCGIWKEEWPFSPPECVEYLERQKDSIPYEKYVEDIAAINAEAKLKYHAGWNDGYEAKQKEQKPELVQHPPITYTYPSDASRDEQLKRAIMALLNSDLIKVAGNKFTKQDLIDWVEKMSEENIKKIRSEEYTEGYTDAIKANTKWQKEQKPEITSASTIMIPSCWEEKKEKPKPVEWSEEEKKIISNIRRFVFDHASENFGVDVNGDYCKDEYEAADDFLKSLHPQILWQRAHAGTQFRSKALMIDDDGELRLSKVAVNDCWYILVKKLLPKED